MINKLLDMKLPKRIAVIFLASFTLVVFLFALTGVLFGHPLQDATIIGIKLGFVTGLVNAMFISIVEQ